MVEEDAVLAASAPLGSHGSGAQQSASRHGSQMISVKINMYSDLEGATGSDQ
jgi:hypothetical protein